MERDGTVATLALTRPERRNALTPDAALAIATACDELDADPTVGAVVVTGGSWFCAGADRTTLLEATGDLAGEPAWSEVNAIYRAFVRVGELGVPTVAAVVGGAVGAGLNLMLAADLRVVADDARIIPAFAALGIHPGGGHFALLGRSGGGREAAAALGLFGEEIDGRRAYELGIAWERAPAGDVERRAHELAARAAADPELARAAVRSFRTELGPPALPWPAALEVERAIQMWSLRRRSD